MRRIILFLCLLLFYQFLFSQNITQMEYFIDIDPGYGAGVQVTIIPGTDIEQDFIVDLMDVVAGFHILHVRAKDENGKWSLNYSRPFLKEAQFMPDPAPDIVKMEYFIDDDPGFGMGVNLPLTADSTVVKDFIVDLTGVANGFHILHVRTKDANRLWSLNYSRPFLKEATSPVEPLPEISSMNWYFSSDTVLPGDFNYTDFEHHDSVSVDFTASLQHLNPDSSYFIHVFAKDANGGRSFGVVHEFGIEFYNTPPEVVQPLADFILDEDFEKLTVADLDTAFWDADAYTGDSLRFSLDISGEPVSAELDGSLLNLHSEANLFGVASIIVTATDDSLASVSDTFRVTVNPVNDPPVCLPVSDVTMYEDHPDTVIANLDTVFTDVDQDTLEFSMTISDEYVEVIVDSLNRVIVSLAENWSGNAMLVLTASDAEYAIGDTVMVYVIPVNDGPTVPLILAPANGSELSAAGALVWTFSSDIEGDGFSYHIQVDDSTEFNNPEIDELHIGLETILKKEPNNWSKTCRASGDSAYYIVLSSLTGFENLVDNARYYWRVRSIDDRGAISDWQSSLHHFYFNTMNNPPQPVISGFTPADSIAIGTLTPTIAWNAATDPDPGDPPGALCYELQLSQTFDFEDTLAEYTTTQGINSVKVEPLIDDNIFFYRLRTVDDEELFSLWSPAQAFITNTALDPPGDFELLSPSNGQDSLATQVTFCWQESHDKDFGDWAQYILYYGPDTNNYVPVKVGRDTVYAVSEVLANGQYFWKVCAIDTDSLFNWATDCEETPFTFWIGAELGIDGRSLTPERFSVSQNYPNPFNPTTTIHYQLPKASDVELTVYDLTGRLVRTLVSEFKEAGYYSVIWNAERVSSGLYLYVLEADGFRAVRKCLVVK